MGRGSLSSVLTEDEGGSSAGDTPSPSVSPPPSLLVVVDSLASLVLTDMGVLVSAFMVRYMNLPSDLCVCIHIFITRMKE